MKKLDPEEWVYIEKSFILNESLSTPAKFLYIVLLSFTNQNNNTVSPTRKKLLKILNCSDTSLTKYFDELSQNNLIEIRKNKIEGSKFLKNAYLIKEYTLTIKDEHGKIKDSSMLTFFDTQNVSSKLINNINMLINNRTSDSSSLISILDKYKSKLGEEELQRILNHIISSNTRFNNENKFEAYLATAYRNAKKKEKVKEQRKKTNPDEPGWM